MQDCQVDCSLFPKKLWNNNEIDNHGSDYVIFLWQNVCGILKFHQFSELIFFWLNLNFVINSLKTIFFSLKNPFLKHLEDNLPVALYGMNCYGYDRYGVKPSLPDCLHCFQPVHFRLRWRSRIELIFSWSFAENLAKSASKSLSHFQDKTPSKSLIIPYRLLQDPIYSNVWPPPPRLIINRLRWYYYCQNRLLKQDFC